MIIFNQKKAKLTLGRWPDSTSFCDGSPDLLLIFLLLVCYDVGSTWPFHTLTM